MELSGRSLAVEAARVSLGTPFAPLVLSSLLRKLFERLGLPLALPILLMVLCVCGFVLGLWALTTVRRHGTRGILIYGIGGVFFNGLLFIWLLKNAYAFGRVH
jgi:hypothetical protein